MLFVEFILVDFLQTNNNKRNVVVEFILVDFLQKKKKKCCCSSLFCKNEKCFTFISMCIGDLERIYPSEL